MNWVIGSLPGRPSIPCPDGEVEEVKSGLRRWNDGGGGQRATGVRGGAPTNQMGRDSRGWTPRERTDAKGRSPAGLSGPVCSWAHF